MSGTRISPSSASEHSVKPNKSGLTGKSETGGKISQETENQKALKGAGGKPVSEEKKPVAAPGTQAKTLFTNRDNRASSPNLPLTQVPLSENTLEATLKATLEATLQAPDEQIVLARELFNQTAAALGLPRDALSTALLAFARFFSLHPALLGTLRREILTSGKSSSPASAKEKAALEAEALAAVIAVDKGVELSPEALERYARLLSSPVSESPASADGNEVPSAEELRAIAEEQSKRDGLLNLLNFLPGKNGQYWMIFPFNISVKGIELTVIIRILKGELLSSGEEVCLIADVSGQKRQWRFFLRKTVGKFRADIRVYPDCLPRTLKFLQKKAERFLKEAVESGEKPGFFKEILVQNGGEVPSWVEDLCAESLPSINKEV